MKKIMVDLLGKTIIRRKQKRIRYLITILYVMVWFFSLLTLFYVHKTNLFISSVYQKEINKIATEVESQSPKLERIKKLYKEKNEIESKKRIYLQSYHRPGNWLNKMVYLSNAIPGNMRLEQIVVNANPAKRKSEKMKLTGYTLLDMDKQNQNQLNIFKQAIEKQDRFMEDFERVDILENRIGQKGDDPIMSFTIGIY
jgi:cell division protein YceG involved in septum cleavage